MLINFTHLKTFYNALVHRMKSFRGNWNQNDSAAEDYIKNRPFYIDNPKEDLIVSDLTSAEYKEGLAPPCNFIPGEKYAVIWNGIRYDNVICYYDDPYNILGEDHPFYIDDDGGNSLYIEAGDGGDFTVSIYHYTEIIHKLDSKYLSDDVITADKLNEVTFFINCN